MIDAILWIELIWDRALRWAVPLFPGGARLGLFGEFHADSALR